MKRLDFAISTVAAVSITIYSSAFYALLDAKLSAVLLGIMLICVAIACTLSLVERKFLSVGLVLLMVTVLAFFTSRFGDLTGVPANYNSIAGYATVLCFAVFCRMGGDQKSILILLEKIAIVYVVLYLGVSALAFLGVVRQENAPGLILNDYTRSNRVFIVHGLAFYLLGLSLVRLNKGRGGVMNFTVLLLVTFGIFLSQSRVFMGIAVLLAIIFIATRSVRLLGALCFGVVMATFSWAIVQVLTSKSNPFEAMKSDSSAFIRYLEYRHAQQEIAQHWFLGVGIPSSQLDQATWLSAVNFSTLDLGIVGIWFTFGVLGILGYVFSAWLACTVVKADQENNDPHRRALAFSASGLALYSIIAPSLWYGGGTLIFAIVVAFWLNGLGSRSINMSLDGARLGHFPRQVAR